MSAPYRLVYWPTLPGRGELVRVILEDQGIPYADVARTPDGPDFKAVRAVLDSGGGPASNPGSTLCTGSGGKSASCGVPSASDTALAQFKTYCSSERPACSSFAMASACVDACAKTKSTVYRK